MGALLSGQGGGGTALAGTGFVHVTGGVQDTAADLTGDVTAGSGGVTTIANDAVTLAKMANIATARIIGRTTAGTGDPESLTATQIIAMLTSVERLSADGAASPTTDITFVSGTGTDLTLADGTIDGFIKNFVVTGGNGTITPANLADGNVLTYASAPANVSFIWDATGVTWHVYGNPYNMVTT